MMIQPVANYDIQINIVSNLCKSFNINSDNYYSLYHGSVFHQKIWKPYMNKFIININSICRVVIQRVIRDDISV